MLHDGVETLWYVNLNGQVYIISLQNFNFRFTIHKYKIRIIIIQIDEDDQ